MRTIIVSALAALLAATICSTLAQAAQPAIFATFGDGNLIQALPDPGTALPNPVLTNVTGLPAVSVPLFWSEDGLPIGVQLIGRPADEAGLLRISAQLEQARPWRDRRPPAI